jgi:hypothetical protein
MSLIICYSHKIKGNGEVVICERSGPYDSYLNGAGGRMHEYKVHYQEHPSEDDHNVAKTDYFISNTERFHYLEDAEIFANALAAKYNAKIIKTDEFDKEFVYKSCERCKIKKETVYKFTRSKLRFALIKH